MIWLTVLVFVGLLLVLVLVHELGHLLAAKRAGCNVEEFGFGFPPRIASKIWRGTRYSFNLIPLGGFVKIEGEDMAEQAPGPGSFATKSAPWRIFILAAGVIMNVILAAVLFTWQGVIGVPTVVTAETAASLDNQLTYIVEVVDESPAAAAGVTAYDRIVSIGGIEQPTIEQVTTTIGATLGEELSLELDRQGVREQITIVPRVDPPEGEGALGVSLLATGITKIPVWQAPWHGITRTWDMTAAIVTQFWEIGGRLVREGSAGETLTGPVGIAIYTNEATKLGLTYVLEFGALISLNLALINILPIPALDGGRILFVFIELIIRRPVPGKVEQTAHTVGFVALIGLMLLVTWRDIIRFF
ncbi:hypothetical protein CL628_03075 [bacterium]|nr:hypothetical protein [bacterium]